MGDDKDPAKVLDIKTTDIKRAAPDFQTGTEDLSRALTALVKSLDALGEPWGHDKGNEFGNAYKPLQKKIESTAEILVLDLTSILSRPEKRILVLNGTGQRQRAGQQQRVRSHTGALGGGTVEASGQPTWIPAGSDIPPRWHSSTISASTPA